MWCPESGPQRERLVSALLPLFLDATAENVADLVALALERYVGTLDSDKCLSSGTPGSLLNTFLSRFCLHFVGTVSIAHTDTAVVVS